MSQMLSERTATLYESATVSLESAHQNTNIYNGFQMFAQEILESMLPFPQTVKRTTDGNIQ